MTWYITKGLSLTSSFNFIRISNYLCESEKKGLVVLMTSPLFHNLTSHLYLIEYNILHLYLQ